MTTWWALYDTYLVGPLHQLPWPWWPQTQLCHPQEPFWRQLHPWSSHPDLSGSRWTTDWKACLSVTPSYDTSKRRTKDWRSRSHVVASSHLCSLCPLSPFLIRWSSHLVCPPPLTPHRLQDFFQDLCLISVTASDSVVTGKHYMPSAVGSISFSMKSKTLHLIAGFNNIQHI